MSYNFNHTEKNCQPKFASKNTLSSLLYESYSKKDITHMDMHNKGSYSIFDDDELLKRYTRSLVFLSKTNNFNRYLLERSTDIGPVIVDIDLAKELDVPEPLYTKEMVLKLARSFQKNLKSLLKTEANLDCFVLEKPGYFKLEPETKTETKTYKNGFHLHFPHVWLSKRERLYINSLVFKDTEIELDNSIVGGNWFLYGSRKSPESSAYEVTYIIEEKRNHVSNLTSKQELVYLLSIREKPYTIVNELTFVDEVVVGKKHTKREPINFDNHSKKTIKELKHYMKQLHADVSDDYVSWRQIGCALYNETHGSGPGKKIWHSFSEMSDKYDEDVSDKFWESLTENSCSLGTIIHYIKVNNNKGEYKEYKVSRKVKESKMKRLLR